MRPQRCDGCRKYRVGLVVVDGRDLCPACAGYVPHDPRRARHLELVRQPTEPTEPTPRTAPQQAKRSVKPSTEPTEQQVLAAYDRLLAFVFGRIGRRDRPW